MDIKLVTETISYFNNLHQSSRKLHFEKVGSKILIMKILITAIFFIFSISTSFSQSSCISINEIDPFTKKKKVETKQISLTSAISDAIFKRDYTINMLFGIKNDSLIVAFNFQCEGCKTVGLKKAMLIFSNDSVITIDNLIIEAPRSEKTIFLNTPTNGRKSYSYLSSEELKIYQERKIEKIRIETIEGRTADYELKEKKSKQLMEIAECIKKIIKD